MYYLVFLLSILLFQIEAVELLVPDDIKQDCAFIPSYPEPSWVLIARQTVPEYWDDKTWIDRNTDNSFAGWSLLENYRSSDGYFKLKFIWPFESASLANIWKQTNNPAFAVQNAETYIPITIDYPGTGSQSWSNGLGKSDSGQTLIQGGAPSRPWSYAVGQFEVYQPLSESGIRGAPPQSPVVQRVEVYAMACPSGYRLSSQGDQDTCVPSAFAIDSCANSNSMTNWAVYPSHTDSIEQKCPNAYTIIRTWTAIDSCAEEKSAFQTITITDDIAPILTKPIDYESECIIPDETTSGSATAIDNCSTNVTINFSDLEIERDVGYYIISRTWSTTDSCGNSVSDVQKITVFDNIAPKLDEPVSDIELSACDDTIDLSTIPDPLFSDNCFTPPTVTYTDRVEEGSNFCPEKTIYRNWTAVDSFGNSFSVVQIIVIKDNTKPILTLPDDTTVLGCKGNDDPLLTGFATATDNCGLDPTVSYTDSESDGAIIRTWSATDSCNNTATADQIITIEKDINGPEFDLPLSSSFWCNYTVPTPSNVTDNCNASAITLSYEESQRDLQTNCPQDYSLNIKWTLVDENGNPTIKDTPVNVQVTTEINWTGPDVIEVLCNQDFSPELLNSPLANDQCSRAMTYTWKNSIDTITCESDAYNFTRTFKAEWCNVLSFHTQTITVLPLPVNVCPCINGVCDSENKTCLGCIKNWYGTYCQSKCENCSPGRCNDGILGTGECITVPGNDTTPGSPDNNQNDNSILQPVAIVGITFVVVIIILILIAIIITCKRQHSFNDESQEVLLI